MALRLLLAFFPFIAVAEIEENCNVQLPALQSGNSGKFNNGASPAVNGFTAEGGFTCMPDGSGRYYSLELCEEECGCAFALRQEVDSCQCCRSPLERLKDIRYTLYTSNSCFSTTPAPTTSPALNGFTAEGGFRCWPDGSGSYYSLETCPEECGCAFAVREDSCQCCGSPLTRLASKRYTLYTSNSCFSTTPAPTTSPALNGFTAEGGFRCWPDESGRYYSLELCEEECGCAFALLQQVDQCHCCRSPLERLKADIRYTLYTSNSCFSTTPAPTTSPALNGFTAEGGFRCWPDESGRYYSLELCDVKRNAVVLLLCCSRWTNATAAEVLWKD